MNVDMQPVASSNVAAIGYDAVNEDVYVEFIGSGLYVYNSVPLPVFQDFESAPSKGSFVHQILKPGYPCQQL